MWPISWDGPCFGYGFLIVSIIPGIIGWLIIHLRAPVVEDPKLVKWVPERETGWKRK